MFKYNQIIMIFSFRVIIVNEEQPQLLHAVYFSNSELSNIDVQCLHSHLLYRLTETKQHTHLSKFLICCRDKSLNRQLLDMLFWQEKSNQVTPGRKNSNRSKITFPFHWVGMGNTMKKKSCLALATTFIHGALIQKSCNVTFED